MNQVKSINNDLAQAEIFGRGTLLSFAYGYYYYNFITGEEITI